MKLFRIERPGLILLALFIVLAAFPARPAWPVWSAHADSREVSVASQPPASTLDAETLERVRAGGTLVSDSGSRYVIPISGSETLPLVDVMINGEGPFALLLDFGANVLLLNPETAKIAGVDYLVVREGTDIARARHMAIDGGLIFENVHFGVDENLRDVAGVVGFNIFRWGNISWDSPGRRVTVNADISLQRRNDTVPLAIESRMPYVTLEIDGRPVEFALDTGAAEWMTLPPAMAASLVASGSERPGPQTYNNQTGERQVDRAKLGATLQLGGRGFRELEVYVNPDADTAWLGMSLLKSCRFELDIAAGLAAFDCIRTDSSPPEQIPVFHF